MYVETADGRAKRSEYELRNILERKYAYAFSTGGAGAVQWIWNINYYMNNINESHIGALRADGTEKPETNVSYDFGAFMGGIRDLFVGREMEDVAVIFPYSNDFSNRKFASEATGKLLRVLSYELNIHVRGLGEYQLDSLDTWKPKLIIVPSPHTMNSEALKRLLAHVRQHGGTLFMSGPLQFDEYWHPVDRLTEELGIQTTVSNLLREELLEVNGRQWMVSFGYHIATGYKQTPITETGGQGGAGAAKLVERPLGKGSLIWCPLPVEINSRMESVKAVYEYVLASGNVKPELEWLTGGELPGIYGRKLSFSGGALFIFVSEYGAPVEVSVKNPDTGKTYAFRLESERSVLFATNKQGDLLAVYRPDEVKISKFNH